ncbi:MAG: MvaI/BcnI restriction endonuclease family protein [Methanobrevibacter olleyae]|uniref:MvaI/BcnI restriction endonuclease family protein n=1 Tax=Methanobrevibacter olleyae TaxID=294671 RepID=A0A8T3VW32_METOL|nr:MvaI/BcnI restriction endonuclease family protein [Methanobrevibacter olleyae]
MDDNTIKYIKDFLPIFSELNIDVSFLFVTETAYKKNIIDATKPVREFLKRKKIHDYDSQKQNNPKLKINNSVEIPTIIINENSKKEIITSMYRPNTKKGDPRIWFRKSQKYINPNSIIAVMAIENKLVITNLSDKNTKKSLFDKGFVYEELSKIFIKDENCIANELLNKIKSIYNKGFVKTIGIGDPSVGETLEYYLNIPRNNSKNPDYKGIELKAKRSRAKNRSNLFTQVPMWKCENGLNEEEIFEKYSYYSEKKERMDLYCTLKANKPNPQGLYLKVDFDNNLLYVLGKNDEFLTQWDIDFLIKRLEEKHNETFWLDVETKIENNEEYFRYYRIEHTKKPKSTVFPFLINEGIITVDFLIHQKENGKLRDHGFPFKINKKDRNLLFEDMEVYDLRKS